MRPLAINSVIEEIEVVQATAFVNVNEDADADGIEDNSISDQQKLSSQRRPLWPTIYSAQLPENSKEIFILGLFVAILATILIVLTAVILVRRKQERTVDDRELLIESEILPKILHV